MKKETSVEWFAKKDGEITIKFLEGKINQIQLAIEKTKCLEQAKQMHKQEIAEAFEVGYDNGGCVNEDESIYHGSNYYKKKYGGSNE